MLGRAFAGVVDDAKIEVYHAALEDLSDAELATATAHVIKTYAREFIPPPAVLREAIAPAPTVVDGPSVLRKIEKLATYNPNCGMVYPRADVVRDKLGEPAAYAYVAAGGPRIFSDNETTRSIAEREFSKAITEAANRPNAALPMIGGDPPRPRLVGGSR
jgi:hypothetical protein